jgi:hypothetical protein
MDVVPTNVGGVAIATQPPIPTRRYCSPIICSVQRVRAFWKNFTMATLLRYLSAFCSTKRVQQIPLFPPLPKNVLSEVEGGDERGISLSDSVTHKQCKFQICLVRTMASRNGVPNKACRWTNTRKSLSAGKNWCVRPAAKALDEISRAIHGNAFRWGGAFTRGITVGDFFARGGL